ncbi:MAG TPA: primosomal protein N' [Streptosporangiaceae bacterium]|nr:primosomal protein N' [Streptosporangiaceae bacterium]
MSEEDRLPELVMAGAGPGHGITAGPGDSDTASVSDGVTVGPGNGASVSDDVTAGPGNGASVSDGVTAGPGNRRSVRPASQAVASQTSRSATGRTSRRSTRVPAETLPVAQVAVDLSLAHLDRPFDYLVPERLSETAVPGCRVRVRFAGQLVDGFLLSREATSEHDGKLAFLERVVSPEPVLTPEIAALARAVADRYAGTLADVLRLAIPPRHAAAEAGTAVAGAGTEGQAGTVSGAGADAAGPDTVAAKTETGHTAANGASSPHAGAGSPQVLARSPQPGTPSAGPAPGSPETGAGPAEAGAGFPPGGPASPPPSEPWARYPAGRAFLAALAAGRAPRAVWSALPGPRWAEEIARAAATTAASGRGTLIVVPDARDLAQIDEALSAELGAGRHVCVAAGLGPAERYRRWLSVLRGEVKVVAGLRGAMFAPVKDLGLVVIWDDGDDLHAERRAPYPHAREVLALRAHRLGAAALIGGFARTVEATQLVAAGWARPLTGDRRTIRTLAPMIRGTGDDAELAKDEAASAARLPSLALRTAREALGRGPVLVQVPRGGYLAAVACGRCREQARCETCGGPLSLGAAGSPPGCSWCGAVAASWSCANCGFTRLRSIVTGAARTAEELGHAFSSVPVRTSAGQAALSSVPATPAVVVATPGAEPIAPGGYAAALLLDGRVLLGRASLRAAEEALRRWLNAAALVRPASEGGRVVVVADAALAAVQALVRWDPVTHSEREHAERKHLRFPPAVRMAAAFGPQAAVTELIEATELPPGAEVLGPVPNEAPEDPPADEVRVFFRAPRRQGAGLARALQAAQAVRSARKASGAVRVQMDPLDLI